MFQLTVFMYHYVRDPGDAAEQGSGIPGLPIVQFEAQVERAARLYEIISWRELRDRLLARRSLPTQACLLTFDDGVCDHYWNVFPILQRHHVSGLFFALARRPNDGLILGHKLHYLLVRLGLQGLRAEIWARLDATQREHFSRAEAQYRLSEDSETTVFKTILQREFAEIVNPWLSELLETHIATETELARQLYLNDAQIREMRAGGMHFGGHSRTHPWFDLIPASQRADEILASRRWLAEFEDAPFAFAYPYGGWAEDAPAQLAEQGFVAAFTTRPQARHHDPFCIGRYDGQEWDG